MPTPRPSATPTSAIGRDDANVTTQVMDLGDNRVNVVFNIQEGDRTKIAAINFIGNSAFSDRRLSDVIATKRSTILSFLLRDDIYDEDRLRADEEALRRFYYNRGYADFRVVSAFGELDRGHQPVHGHHHRRGRRSLHLRRHQRRQLDPRRRAASR